MNFRQYIIDMNESLTKGEDHSLVSFTPSKAFSIFLKDNKIPNKVRIAIGNKKPKAEFRFPTTRRQTKRYDIYPNYTQDEFVSVYMDSTQFANEIKQEIKKSAPIKESFELRVLEEYYKTGKIMSIYDMLKYVKSMNQEQYFKFGFYDVGVRMIESMNSLGLKGSYEFNTDKGALPSEIRKLSKELLKKAGVSLRQERWNPADIWLFSSKEITTIRSDLSKITGIRELGIYLSYQLKKRVIVPISLKDKDNKSGGYKLVIVNKPLYDNYPKPASPESVSIHTASNFFLSGNIQVKTSKGKFQTALKWGRSHPVGKININSPQYDPIYYDKDKFDRVKLEGAGNGHQLGQWGSDFYPAMLTKEYNPRKVKFFDETYFSVPDSISDKVFYEALSVYNKNSSILKGWKNISLAEFRLQHLKAQIIFVAHSKFVDYISTNLNEWTEMSQLGPLCLVSPDSAPYVIFK